MLTVAALLYPEALASSVTLPLEILGAADQLTRARSRPAPPIRVSLLSLDDTPRVSLSTGITLTAQGRFDSLEQCDLLLLPAIWRRPQRVLQRCRNHDVLRQIRAWYANGCSVCSVGTASNLLAATGLLDRRPATTHWHDFDAFTRRYPQIILKRRHLMTRSERLYCVGSVNSIADFMVHWVGQHYGASIARGVEAQFSPEVRQDFDSATFLDEAPEAHHDALVRSVQDQLRDEFAEAHTLTELASRRGLSARSLNRRFRLATGMTPMTYLRDRRLGEARSLLQHSDLPIAEIAWRCGFTSASRFAQAFRDDQRMTPRRWRDAVRGKRFGETHRPGAQAAPAQSL